jgi:peroxiredoxin Q/BCP
MEEKTAMKFTRMISRIFGLATLGLLVSAGAQADSPAVGSAAPEFRLQDQNGDWHTLEQYRGKWVAVYFYPKDDTPGCTTEACNFRDNIFAFQERDAVILGISLDDVESHREFAEKYSLPFSLLSDPAAEVADQYGVVTNLGITKFAKRQSFLITPDGTVARHYAKVDPDTHSEEILSDLVSLQGMPSS